MADAEARVIRGAIFDDKRNVAIPEHIAICEQGRPWKGR